MSGPFGGYFTSGVFDPADVLFLSIAHEAMIASPRRSGEDWASSWRSRAVGRAKPLDRVFALTGVHP